MRRKQYGASWASGEREGLQSQTSNFPLFSEFCVNDDQELFIKRTNSPTFSEIPQFTYYDGMDQLPVMEYVACDRVCICNLLGDLWVGFVHHTCGHCVFLREIKRTNRSQIAD